MFAIIAQSDLYTVIGNTLPKQNSRHAKVRQWSILWVEAVATSKLLESPYSHIKGNSVLKACWADMP